MHKNLKFFSAYKFIMELESNLSCHECDKSFSRKCDLYKHLRRVHKIEHEISGMIECSQCIKKVRGHRELLTHLNVQHKI